MKERKNRKFTVFLQKKKKKKRRKLDNKQRENGEMVKGRNNFLVDERSTCAYYDINKRKSNSGIDYDRL